MRNFISIIFVASLLITVPFSIDLNAQAGTQKSQNDDMKQKYRKARVLQTSTAKKITKVVEALERVNEEGKEDPDWVTVRAILNELLANKNELKSYDRSVMWNYWGYVYFSDEDSTGQCMRTNNSSRNQKQPSHLEQHHYLQSHNFIWLKATSKKALITS